MTTTLFLRSPARRRLLAGGLALLLAGPSARAQDSPGHTVPAAQLQEAVAQRFPLRYSVAGLADLVLRSPQLRLLPAQNRLGLVLALAASGPALGQTLPGQIDLDFALRYEPRDKTLRAHQIALRSLRLQGLAPAAAELLQSALPGLVRDALLEVVVYRVQPQDLALPDAMGLAPDRLTVTDDGLRIGLAPKR